MSILNVEFKAKCKNLEKAEATLLELNPLFKGEDHQKDTYFNVPNGRLKLREGNIENALIQYERENTAGSKSSLIQLYRHQPDPTLKAALVSALGIWVVVDKRRKIYFIENVKFHFDTIDSLGTFLEVEAIDADGSIGKKQLQLQCDHYAKLLNVAPDDFIAESYSDMIARLKA